MTMKKVSVSENNDKCPEPYASYYQIELFIRYSDKFSINLHKPQFSLLCTSKPQKIIKKIIK